MFAPTLVAPGGFGAPAQNNAFGAPAAAPAFGAPAASGGLFGGAATSAAPSTGFSFGGSSSFGAPAATTTAPTGGLFGAKPATSTFGSFGAAQQPAAGGGLFGGGAAAPAFGAPAPAAGQGTASVPYAVTTVMEPPKEEGKPDPPNQAPHQFQSISQMPAYKDYSFEELRLQDYAANRKTPTAAAPAFGGTGAFGAAATPAFGSAPAATPSIFGGGTTSTFGQPAAASTSAFGQPAQQKSIFGGGSTFGQTTSAPSMFGSTPAAAPAQTGGLFGGGTSAFGQTQQQPAATSTFGGFGAAAAPKPATTGFSFGQTSAAPAAGGGLFGQAQPAATPAANPFGQAASAAPATGGLFGQPAATPAAPAAGGFSFGAGAAAAPKPLFGAAPAATSSFGQPAASKPAFSFGSTPAPAAGGGLFGQQQPAQTSTFGQPAAAPAAGGGLFGGASNPFGSSTTAAPAATSTFGGGGLFGAKPPAPAGGGLFGQPAPAAGGGLFGQSTQQPAQAGGLFGSTNSLGGSFGGASQAQQQPQQSAYAAADDLNAYGSNPLFANSTSAAAAPVEPKKKPPIFTAFRGTPINRSSTKITRLRGFGASTASPGSVASPLSFGASIGPATPGTPASNRGSPLRLVNGIGDEAALSPNAFVSRPSVKKLVIDRKAIGDNFLGKSIGSPDAAGSASKAKDGPASAGRPKVTFNPEVEIPARERLFTGNTSIASGHDDEHDFQGTPVKKSAGSNANLAEESAIGSASKDASSSDWLTRRPASAPVLKKGDYYSKPSMEALQKLPAVALQSVADLIVGREGYGEVAFQVPVDLTTLNSVEDLYGGIIVFEDRNCTIYPETYEGKPAPGQGLNQPAVIALEHCWPLDKATRQPIKDPNHPRLQQHIKRLRNLPDTSFIDYQTDDGRWTFSVEGF
ncbi:nuclear pore complex protein Nup98-Nup96 [Pseudohyphozyma bogoriensis]|nr:nuclear pore complex protein Nup98-Nup96 [Pseudohyphozyma bogoriensis]